MKNVLLQNCHTPTGVLESPMRVDTELYDILARRVIFL